jgi:hypothetical protein
LLELHRFLLYFRKIDFDIALIGVGVYGLPLASYCKEMDKIGFHLGGALQILFGIKGNRWKDLNLDIANYSHWKFPSEDETPHFKNNCEGGCYWK